MKILHIVDSGGMYGKENVILNLVKEQASMGMKVFVIVSGKDTLVEAIKGLGLYPQVDAYHTNTYSTIPEYINTSSVDIVHVHDYKASILFGWRRKLDLIKRPLVRTIHGYTSANKPLLSKIRLYEFLEKLTYNGHDAVVGVSENMEDFKGVTHIVNNGIEPFIPSLVDYWQQRKNNLVVMCTARLSKEKNLDNLIKSIGIIRDNNIKLPNGKTGVKLYIFGEGSQRQYLQDSIREHGLLPENDSLFEVYLMGYDSSAKEYLNMVDIYIQPSYTEGTPISVLEAMCAKTPIITSYVGGMKYLVDQGAVALCGLSDVMIANDIVEASSDHLKSIREDRIEKAYNLFHSRYSSKAMTEGYLNVYNQVSKG